MTIGSIPRLRSRLAAACSVLALGLGACSPTLDWREVRLGVDARAAGVTLPASSLHALFPCKPEIVERVVSLSGARLPSQMHVCQAGGWTWSVTRFQLGDPGQWQTMLATLRAAQRTNVSGSETGPPNPILVAGMTPSAQAVRVSLAGRQRDGSTLMLDSAWVARGPELIQISVMQPTSAPARADAADSFFAGVHW